MFLIDNFQIIGLDITDSKDFSVVTCMCGQCRGVIANRKYNPEINEVEVPFFVKCSKCGIKFKSHIWREDIKFEREN